MSSRPLAVILVLCVGACSSGELTPGGTAVIPAPTTAAPPSTAAQRSSTTTGATSTVSPTPNGVNPDSPCLLRALFGDPAESDYLLPYPIGEEYYLSQSYCFSEGGHRNQLAYDFDLPVGREVLAARAGVVRDLKEDSPDTGLGYGQHNYVFIQHSDGTVAFYAHLMMDGVEVEVNDQVDAGDLIAYAGNSGLTGHPHLHFGVYRGWPATEGEDVPVNFRNASGQHDSRGGLAVWRLFEALPVG